MNSLLLRKPHPNPIGVIIQAVCDEFGIHQTRLLSKCRTAEVALARQTAMYIGRKLTSASTPELADAFNKRNHCTVIHACRVVSFGLVLCVVGGAVLIAGLLTRRMKP